MGEQVERDFTARAEERRVLMGQFPLIQQISIEMDLRDMVIETWVRLWRESGYRDIGEAPNILSQQGGDETLVRHTNAVVRIARSAAKEIQKIYHIPLNLDCLLAGAFLHDVDKLVVYRRNGNLVELSELGHRVPHGEYGARIAEQIGLPPEVVNIIASHTPVRPRAKPASVEAVLVAYCDLAVYQSYRLINGMSVYEFS